MTNEITKLISKREDIRTRMTPIFMATVSDFIADLKQLKDKPESVVDINKPVYCNS